MLRRRELDSTQAKVLAIRHVTAFRSDATNIIFDDFNRDPEAIEQKYKISQKYISDAVGNMVIGHQTGREVLLNTLYCLVGLLILLKRPKRPTGPNTSVVAFTGKPDPDEAMIGQWPEDKKWKRFYKFTNAMPLD